MKSSVLVVGGSLVGLSVALATNRQGSHVTVLERSGGGTVSGGGLGLDVSLLQEVTGLSSAPPVYSGPDRDTTARHLLREWVEVACSEEPSPLASCRPRAVSRAAGVAGRGTGISSQYHHRRDRLPAAWAPPRESVTGQSVRVVWQRVTAVESTDSEKSRRRHRRTATPRRDRAWLLRTTKSTKRLIHRLSAAWCD